MPSTGSTTCSASGTINSGLTTTVGFDDLPAALERLADRTAMGKTVIVM